MHPLQNPEVTLTFFPPCKNKEYKWFCDKVTAKVFNQNQSELTVSASLHEWLIPVDSPEIFTFGASFFVKDANGKDKDEVVLYSEATENSGGHTMNIHFFESDEVSVEYIDKNPFMSISNDSLTSTLDLKGSTMTILCPYTWFNDMEFVEYKVVTQGRTIVDATYKSIKKTRDKHNGVVYQYVLPD
jgi:hypothetical protein